jgi:signal transduction histidine kinase
VTPPVDRQRDAAGIAAAVLTGALITVSALAHVAVIRPSFSTIWLAIPSLVGIVAVAWRRRTWSARTALLAGVLGLQCVLVVLTLVSGPRAADRWLTHHEHRAQARLQQAVQTLHGQHARLERFVAEQAGGIAADSLTTSDPFELCATWRRQWRRLAPGDAASDLAVVLWRGDQRLGWAGSPILDDRAVDLDADRIIHDARHWARRALARPDQADGYLIECQLWLADVTVRGEGRPRATNSVRREVVRDARAPGRRSWGDAERGLRVTEDVVLAAPDHRGVRSRLRLTVEMPPRTVQLARQRALTALAHVVLAGIAWLTWLAAWPRSVAMLLAIWVVRGWWAVVDVVRLLASSLPGGRLPADPGSAASLLDPAYFATTLGRGWFASGADALLTAAVVAATAVWLWRRWPPASGGPVRWARGLAALPLAAAIVVLLRWLWSDLAANANARLIGLQVPLNAWTFWALHAVILAISLALVAALWLAIRRLLGGVPSWLSGPARPAWLFAGLLMIVGLNYAALAETYSRAERDWLRRKAEQIVQPQDELVGFLIDDVLSDLLRHDTELDDPLAVAPGRGALQRDALAHRLWQRSAVRDLGLPGLIEVLDPTGRTESLYSTGFLRDFGYEVISRSDWFTLAGSDTSELADDVVLLQEEVRRYPTGEERVLRGELPRAAQRGWLRLELSTQSLRVSTLLDRLTGARDVSTGGGYRPRLEIDRPVLLVRGDRSRWLDAGFADLPGTRHEPVLAALRGGEREWAEIELSGRRWLCRWAPLPPEVAASEGEGFLIGLQRLAAVEVVLDIGRVLLLDVLLLVVAVGLAAMSRRRSRWVPGFQGRFLVGYLGIGLILLLVAGVLADRQTFQRIDQDARARTRDGLVTMMGQLRGLLVEQARALAGSDYIADLLAGRLAGERRLGPFAVRQGMVFGPDGELLLDETLSDLDPVESERLLEASREAQLVVIRQPGGLYLGVSIAIDLSDVLGETDQGGTFFYRQRVDEQLLPGLGEVIGGEVTLRLDGEVMAASHSGRILDDPSRLLASPEPMQWYRAHPGQPRVHAGATELAFTGGLGLPALSVNDAGELIRRDLPAVLSVEFPDRDREFADERRSTALFLAGLITLLLLTAFGLAMVLTWKIFEPLRLLLGATRQLAAGDFDAPLPPASGDEVGRLAAGFRAMRNQLQTAREVLEAREQFLRTVLERVPVGVLVWDHVGRVAVWNPAAAEILARFYPEIPASGEADADLVRWTARLRDDLAAGLGSGAGELTSADGQRTVRVGQAPVELGADSAHRLVVCEDLTDFLAAKKQALNAELARQVAHEIKNPLTPIQLSAQLVEQALRDDHPRRDAIVTDAVARILEQVTLLRSIAGEFSLLGRPGELTCEPLDLESLVRDTVAGYRTELADGGPRVDVAPGPVPPVHGHRDSLLKVLGNLMQNSLDAVGEPGDLAVAVSWHREPETISVVWRDNGPGIPADVASRLFDPYFSTKSKGTGLGLAICRNLLEKMGGSIALTSGDDGRGAVATVTLRRADRGSGDGDS